MREPKAKFGIIKIPGYLDPVAHDGLTNLFKEKIGIQNIESLFQNLTFVSSFCIMSSSFISTIAYSVIIKDCFDLIFTFPLIAGDDVLIYQRNALAVMDDQTLDFYIGSMVAQFN